jgi:hypothetical protein
MYHLADRMLAEGWIAPVPGRKLAPRGRPTEFYCLTPDGIKGLATVLARADGQCVEIQCCRCKTVKPIDDFHKNAKGPHGRSRCCRSCMKEYQNAKRLQPKPELPPDYTKVCTRCRRTLPAASFVKSALISDGLNSWCRACVAEHHAKSEVRARMRELSRRATYNLTQDQHNALLAESNGRCAICGSEPEANRRQRGLAVDHDHACCPGNRSCGRCVRGLLCAPCNMTLGRLESRGLDPGAWVASVQAYLTRHQERQGLAKRSA